MLLFRLIDLSVEFVFVFFKALQQCSFPIHLAYRAIHLSTEMSVAVL